MKSEAPRDYRPSLRMKIFEELPKRANSSRQNSVSTHRVVYPAKRHRVDIQKESSVTRNVLIRIEQNARNQRGITRSEKDNVLEGLMSKGNSPSVAAEKRDRW